MNYAQLKRRIKQRFELLMRSKEEKRRMNDEMIADTKEEWRELGFFYDYDENNHQWSLAGSKKGLLNLCATIDEYTADPQNDRLGKHRHNGPYFYFELLTNEAPVINKHGINGTIEQLKKLSDILRFDIEKASLKDTLIIGKEYGAGSTASICLTIMPDDFDPASLDKFTWIR